MGVPLHREQMHSSIEMGQKKESKYKKPNKYNEQRSTENHSSETEQPCIDTKSQKFNKQQNPFEIISTRMAPSSKQSIKKTPERITQPQQEIRKKKE